MKTVKRVYDAPPMHWVGDGFPVKTLLSYAKGGESFSPFLLLDRAGPYTFTPALKLRGVGQHPHRGFETVTIVYEGEVAHKDSTGEGGVIGAGDVQWMSAASGIVHQEFHSEVFTKKGGVLDMVQLWVNLPAKSKMSPPKYQAITNQQIPSISMPKATVRIIAGNCGEIIGPAETFTPMDVWDISLQKGSNITLEGHEGWNTMLIAVHGSVRITQTGILNPAQMALLSTEGSSIQLQSDEGSTVLLLSGEPLNEPIAGYGPFVMNTKDEIAQAIDDYENGNFGKILP